MLDQILFIDFEASVSCCLSAALGDLLRAGGYRQLPPSLQSSPTRCVESDSCWSTCPCILRTCDVRLAPALFQRSPFRCQPAVSKAESAPLCIAGFPGLSDGAESRQAAADRT